MLKTIVGLDRSYHAGLLRRKTHCLAVEVACAWSAAHGEKMMSLTYKGEDRDLKGQQQDKSKAERVKFPQWWRKV